VAAMIGEYMRSGPGIDRAHANPQSILSQAATSAGLRLQTRPLSTWSADRWDNNLTAAHSAPAFYFLFTTMGTSCYCEIPGTPPPRGRPREAHGGMSEGSSALGLVVATRDPIRFTIDEIP
jgi:hypothetical protein